MVNITNNKLNSNVFNKRVDSKPLLENSPYAFFNIIN
ncbi:hypothetical protein NSMM_880007 [Nitrosomonas mobilis]|uniref:Uncharacterized protein n=1 Tax=Nitrosomonas mobilis TaxID=51642 RepID=A0A1G5SKD5_9PROT|nr:hypothetical protein NSMM_880007 [Nitrosomonas mobilis]